MGIGDFFKRLTKGSAKDSETDSTGAAEDPPLPGRKRPMGLRLPGWAKKDNAFVRPGMGMMKPPEEMAEEASFKRPGVWLKNKLGGVSDRETLEKLEKTKENRGTAKKGLSDQELEEIFHGLLGPEEGEPEASREVLEKKE